MKIGQYGGRKPKNVIGGGKRGPSNEFNTGLKRERHPDPPQFSSSKVEERKQFSETRDARPGKSSSGSRSSSGSSGSSGGKSSGKSSGVRNSAGKFVQQVAGMAAGTVMVTSSYQEMVEAREAKLAEAMNAQAVVEKVEQGTDYGDENSTGDDITVDTDDHNTDDANDENTDEDFNDNIGENGNESISERTNQNTEGRTNNNTNNRDGRRTPADGSLPITDSPDKKVGENNDEDSDGNRNPSEETDSSNDETGSTQPSDTSQLEIVSQKWEWSEETATVIITDSAGDEHSISAAVKTEETPASCTEDGEITYSAVAVYDNNTYTDTQTKPISATGHHIGEGKVTSDGDKMIYEYQCETCGEKFVIEITINEED